MYIPSAMCIDHPKKRIELVDVDVQGVLEGSRIGGAAKQHTVHQVELLRNQPEERPHFDRRHELDDFGAGLAKHEIGQARAVRTDDKLRVLKQNDLIHNAHALEIDGLKSLS